ncbi:MAG: TrkH family potassium uptake protein [Bacillus sp. (in: firmicutes)]
MKKLFFFKYLKPAQVIVIYYFLAVTISAILINLPIALQPGVNLPFVDSIFLAVSAVSVTGLSVVDITETFSVYGYFILMFILQFGGIGIMTLGTFLWLLFRKKIGLRERRLIMSDQNQVTLAGLVALLRQVLFLIIGFEIVGALVLGIYLTNYYPTISEAFLQGLFMSVSATTNAGFDIVGSSLVPFAHDYFVQLINIILIILGSIGFPVLIEVKAFLFRKNHKMNYQFSLFTKLTTVTFFFLAIFGTLAILILEYKQFFIGKSWHESFFYALFQSVSTRNAGLATMDMTDFSEPTLLIMCVLMFIGASPSSVGGGIRTTTFAVGVLAIYHFARGHREIQVFGRQIHEEDVFKSFIVMFMALFICGIATLLLCIFESFSLMEIVFEVSSAFGTTGLSLGITPELSVVGKCIVIILMFIGRVGIISFLLIFGLKQKENNYHYPKERIIIG